MAYDPKEFVTDKRDVEGQM